MKYYGEAANTPETEYEASFNVILQLEILEQSDFSNSCSDGGVGAAEGLH